MSLVRRFLLALCFTFATLLSAGVIAGPPSDGELRDMDGSLMAWDGEQEQWLSPLMFWEHYAERQGGITWGRSAVYPPYEQVKEFDTFMAEAEGGPCLMQFFHSRWRRANDVRRWDEKFNSVAGCPRVFD